MLDSVIFWVFAILAVGGSLGALFHKSAIYAVLCLIAVFMSIAGFYVLNNADFLAISQIIIYAVGLTIIMLFAVMLTGDRPLSLLKSYPSETEGQRKTRLQVMRASRLAYGIIIAYVLVLLLRGMTSGMSPSGPLAAVAGNTTLLGTIATQGTTGLLGQLLFNQYALPFELASVLLLAAMIGAIVIAKKQFEESNDSLSGTVRLPLDSTSFIPVEAAQALLQMRSLEHSTDEALKKQPRSKESGSKEGSEFAEAISESNKDEIGV